MTSASPSNQTVLRARNGDPRALEAIVRQASPGIYRYVLSMVRSEEEARELTQETFLKAIKHLDRYDPRYSFMTWLYRIARNLCIDRARRLSHWRRQLPRAGDEEDGDPIENEADPQDSQLDRLLAHEQRWILDQAMAQLKPNYREVLVLYHIEELSYQEIARVLGIPIGTVMNRIFRARKQLHKILRHYAVFQREEPAMEATR